MESVKIKSFPSCLQFNAHPFLNFAHLNKTIVTPSKHEFYSKTWNRKYPDEHIGFRHMETKIIMIIVFVMLSCPDPKWWMSMPGLRIQVSNVTIELIKRIQQPKACPTIDECEEWKKIKWILGKWRVLCKLEYNIGLSLKLIRAEKNKIKTCSFNTPILSFLLKPYITTSLKIKALKCTKFQN